MGNKKTREKARASAEVDNSRAMVPYEEPDSTNTKGNTKGKQTKIDTKGN